MPIKLSAIQKTNTPRINIEDGWYPAVIAGLILPTPTNYNQNLEYLVQVQLPGGRYNYVNTIPFTLTLHQDSSLFKLLKKLTDAETTEDMIQWFRENSFVNSNDEFDEAMFIDYPINAYVICRTNTKTHTKYNLVTEFDYADNDFTLDLTRLVPRYWGKGRVLKLAEGLELTSEPIELKNEECNDNH